FLPRGSACAVSGPGIAGPRSPMTAFQSADPASDRGEARFVPRSGATWRDPFGMYAALREHDPVHHVANGDYWVLSRFVDVLAAAQNTTTFSSAQGLTFAYDEMERVGLRAAAPMVMLDPPEHTAFRR